MKNLFVILPFFIFVSCSKENTSEYIPIKIENTPGPITTIEFEREIHYAGEVKQGTTIKAEYPFTNTGNHPLIIKECKGSGGSLVPEWPKDPIPIGGKDTIRAALDTQGKIRHITKSFRCICNIKELQYRLKIEADIKENIAELEFDYLEFDAGEVIEGTVVEYTFPFKNVGEYPLVIRNCKSSCGCVVPDCPKRIIPVGEKGVFKAKFSTKGKTGIQHKTLTMIANTIPSNTVLRLKARILPKDE